MRWTRLLTLALLTTGLASCGSGGGGGSGTSGTATTTNFASTDYNFFVSTASSTASLKAYDPVADAITTIPTNKLGYEASVRDGTVDPTTHATSNLHISDVIYWDNGSYYSVSTTQSGTLAVSQRSSYSGTVCDQNLTNNYLVFTDAGTDGTCSTGDDHVYAITTSMSSTDSPIFLPVKPLAVLFSDYSTAVGLLYVNAGTLYFSDANGQNPQTLLGSVTSVSEMDNVGSSVLLNIDGKVEMFDESAKTLSGAIYTASNPLSRVLSDGSKYYFFDGSDLYSIPVAGGSYKYEDTVAPASDITPAYLHNNYLVYSTYDSTGGLTTWTLDSLDLSLGSVKVFDTTYDPVSVTVVGYGGDYVYYEISTQGSSDLSNNIAGAINVDGATGRQEITGAGWVGYALSPTIPSGQRLLPSYMVLDKYTLDTTGNPTGGNISIYDAATDTVSSVQGALPAGITRFASVGSIGVDMYGEYFDSSGSKYLAHLNATIANSMRQLDMTTTAVNDIPIM